MPSTHSLRVLDAATSFAVAINRLIEDPTYQLIEAAQLRAAANSIGANIAEGYGKGPGADRLRFFRIAAGSAEEALHHVRLNHRSGRIPNQLFFELNNLGIAIARMLGKLIENQRTSLP